MIVKNFELKGDRFMNVFWMMNHFDQMAKEGREIIEREQIERDTVRRIKNYEYQERVEEALDTKNEGDWLTFFAEPDEGYCHSWSMTDGEDSWGISGFTVDAFVNQAWNYEKDINVPPYSEAIFRIRKQPAKGYRKVVWLKEVKKNEYGRLETHLLYYFNTAKWDNKPDAIKFWNHTDGNCYQYFIDKLQLKNNVEKILYMKVSIKPIRKKEEYV